MQDRNKIASLLYHLPISEFETAADFIEMLSDQSEAEKENYFTFIGWSPRTEEKITPLVLERAAAYKLLKKDKARKENPRVAFSEY